MCIRKADSVGVRFLFVYAYSVFSSMIGFIYLSASRFFFYLLRFTPQKFWGKKKILFISCKTHVTFTSSLLPFIFTLNGYPCVTLALPLGFFCCFSDSSRCSQFCFLRITPIGNRHTHTPHGVVFEVSTSPHIEVSFSTPCRLVLCDVPQSSALYARPRSL